MKTLPVVLLPIALSGCVLVTDKDREAWMERHGEDTGYPEFQECGPDGYEMVYIDHGRFDMGSPEDEVGREADEDLHQVTLTHDFCMGRTEIPQDLYEELTGKRPSQVAQSDLLPVDSVTWHQAAAFGNLLSEREGLDPCYTCTEQEDSTVCTPPSDPYGCEGFRLPTEAEWEYAARAVDDEHEEGLAAFHNGGDLLEGTGSTCQSAIELSNGADLGDIAWHCGNSDGFTQPVGSLDPNAWSIFDMAGNVWEWCHDGYGAYGSDATNPTGEDGSTERVIRGGAIDTTFKPRRLRSASRSREDAADELPYVGFRIARSL